MPNRFETPIGILLGILRDLASENNLVKQGMINLILGINYPYVMEDASLHNGHQGYIFSQQPG